MRYRFILFDVDNTLLDFDRSESNAFINTMKEYEVNCDEDLITKFKEICAKEWDRLNLGKSDDIIIQKNYHKLYYKYSINRFERIKNTGISISAADMSELYLQKLSTEINYMPCALDICEALSKDIKLVIATNGIVDVQKKRLNDMNKYFFKQYISEEIGCIKPSTVFFKTITEDLKVKPDDCLMVGDSLVSDIGGANRVSMDSCWYNPKRKFNNSKEIPTYEISSLLDIMQIVK
ncbi:MAG TPA: HAD-IA family hydrolase [Spirochaetota bacterium]|nr:HAD-IA family hydrolase [Spirochaetota bacterium]